MCIKFMNELQQGGRAKPFGGCKLVVLPLLFVISFENTSNAVFLFVHNVHISSLVFPLSSGRKDL